MAQRLQGKRVLVTQSKDFMGPVTIDVFREHGADVLTDDSVPQNDAEAKAIVAGAGQIDVLIINYAADPVGGKLAQDLTDDLWAGPFDGMVHPMHRMVRAVLPQMYERKSGKIVVYGSATGVKGSKGVGAYSAARAAQVGYVNAVGLEAAPHNVQINLIAQNFVENPDYYPPEVTNTEKFQNFMKKTVPLGRLATAREDALFALFLSSNESDFFVGQAFPFSGGWAQ